MNTCIKPILMVEDSEDDVFFMKRVLKNVDITLPLQVALDGLQAVNYLSGKGEFSDRSVFPLPCIVLLDLKLPGKHGLEVLKWMREQPELKLLVVMILSTSKETSDIETAYRYGANAYLVKPPAVEQLAEMMKAIKLFWLTHNQFAE